MRKSALKACMIHAGFFLFLVSTTYGQTSLLDQTIRVPSVKTTLYEAMNLLSQKADCFFIYDSELVRSDRKVRIRSGSRAVKDILNEILEGTELEYKVIGRHILIRRRTPGFPETIPIPPSQTAGDSIRYIVLRGCVRDNENRSAIPYASVGITEQNIGTVTNAEGWFTLKIPDSLVGTALFISHVGYLSRRIPVTLIRDQKTDICLDRRIISIQEILIRYVDPQFLIEKAMEQRGLNYPEAPAYLTTFYREGVSKNDRYISFSEGVFKIYKTPWFSGEFSDQVKLLKSRKITDAGPSDTVFLKLKAGVQSALQLDIVKCMAGFLDQLPPVEYTYSYSGMVPVDSADAYAIRFEQLPSVENALYKGTMYIDKEHFAILGADFEINPDRLDVAAGDIVLRKSPRLIVKLEQISYSVRYTPYGGRYHLKHVRCDIRLKTRLRGRMASDHFQTFLELATCSIDTTGAVKFPREELLKTGAVFSDRTYHSDDAFWGDFNFITPEAKLVEALSKIRGRLEEIE